MLSVAQLEILSSPGVVRRAAKALEKTAVNWTARENEAWHFDFEAQQGKILPARIEHSRCNCPATGLCKHIVAAALDYLEQQAQPQSFTPPVLNHAKLFDAAGKAACRHVYKLRQSGAWPQAEIQITAQHVEVRWPQQKALILPGDGLDAVLCESGTAAERLLAALLYQPPPSWPLWLEQEQQAAQSLRKQQRDELRGQVKAQLYRLLQSGIRNLQPANLSELSSLVPLLKAEGEHRLGNAVLALQEWVERRSQARGLDPSMEILQQLGLIHALADSTLPPADEQDNSEAALQLLCLGGHRWHTVSGALGLNMLFLSEDGRIFSASLARSGKGQGFSIAEAWRSRNLWPGAPINQYLPGQYVLLEPAVYNSRNGLSLSQKIQVKPGESFVWRHTEDWLQLTQLPEYGYALLKVKECLRCEFDEAEQQLRVQLRNEREQWLLVRQAYADGMAERIVNLQNLYNAQDFYLVVRHVIRNNTHQFEAVCVYREQWLALDFQTPEKQRLDLVQRLLARLKTQPSRELPSEAPLAELCSSALETLLDYPYCPETRIEALNARFGALGLDLLRQKLQQGRRQPEAVLQLVHVLNKAYRLVKGWPVYGA